jgi:hypothetical protein
MSEETTPTASPLPQVTLVDLQGALTIIDTAAERGSFKGNELSAVGAIRDKIEAFLAASMPRDAQGDQAAA